MDNIGKEIRDFYCNGFFGRRYDLSGSIIEGEGDGWVVIRIPEDNVDGDGVVLAEFDDSETKNKYIKEWT